MVTFYPEQECGIVPDVPFLSTQDVTTQVQRFWNAYCHGSKTTLEQMYLPSAIVFGPLVRRSEPAQLTLARRMRKFDSRTSRLSAELGPIDVQIAADVAIASYSYHFHLIKTNSDGSRTELDVPYCRGTHVFQLDQNGALRIIHEHLSIAEPGKKSLIPRDHPAAMQPLSAPRTSNEPTPAAGHAPLQASDTGVFPAANPIPPDEVRAAVRSRWEAVRNKSKGQIEACYFPTAVLIAGPKRSELARLAITRWERELFSPASRLSVDTGSIDVQAAGAAAAIASYTLELQMVRQVAPGKYQEESLPSLRSTLIFRRNENGQLRIWHEHLSGVDVPRAKEISEQKSVLIS